MHRLSVVAGKMHSRRYNTKELIMSNSIKLSAANGATFTFTPCTKNAVPAHYLVGEKRVVTIDNIEVTL